MSGAEACQRWAVLGAFLELIRFDREKCDSFHETHREELERMLPLSMILCDDNHYRKFSGLDHTEEMEDVINYCEMNQTHISGILNGRMRL